MHATSSGKRPRHPRISALTSGLSALVFIVFGLSLILFVNLEMRRHAVEEAREKAGIILDRNLATHKYFNECLKPAVFKLSAQKVSNGYFDPRWMSSTYAVRKIDTFFHAMIPEDHYFPKQYYYKECAINARSPENEADTFEKAFLKKLNTSGSNIEAKAAVRKINGRPFYTVLHRGEVMEGACLRCHSNPAKAPKQLLSLYGPKRSFHRKVGQVVSAVSIRIPLTAAYASANRLSLMLSSLLVVALGLIYGFQYLINRRYIFRPLSAVQKQVDEIAEHEDALGKQIPLPSARELTSLTSAFNAMSQRLRYNVDNLESLVHERTSELADEKERITTTLRSIGDAVIVTDTGGKVTMMNPVAENLTGWKASDGMDQPLEKIFHIINEQTREQVSNPVEKVISSGKIAGLGNHTILLNKNGHEIPIQDSAAPVMTKDGNCLGTVLVFRDTSTQRKNRKVLEESEEKFRKITEASPCALIFSTGLEQTFEYVNPRFTELFGYTLKDVPDVAHWWTLAFSDEAYKKQIVTRWQKQVETAIRTGTEMESLETTVSCKDGTRKTIEWRFIPLGEKNLIFGIDLTDRKEAEKELERSKSRLELATKATNIGYWDRNLLTDEVYFSHTWKRQLGYEVDEIPHRLEEWKSRLHPDDRHQVRRSEKEYLEGRTPEYALEFRLRHKDGSYRWIYTRGEKHLDSEGRPIRMVGCHIDITERKRLEEEILKAQKLESIGVLAGGIAHDFNNILFPILGLSDMLMEDLPPGSIEYENAQEIYRAGKRAKGLVNQILAFSRQSEQKKMPVRMQQILKEVMKLTRSTIPANIPLEEDIQKDCGLVLADPTQMHQILMNLITNAYHAVEETNGKIAVQLKEIEIANEWGTNADLTPGRYAMITVSDTGTGIDPTLTGKIFEPYFTTKEQGKGTGLGLAVVHGIVKEHKGEIKLHSKIGEGSIFTVYLPITEEAGKSLTVEKQNDYAKGNERILLVDDEEAIVFLEKQILERLGYQVTTRVNSVEALAAFKANPDAFDLVVSDMTMPNMTGDQLARELIAIRPDIPIIICTGFSERIDEKKAHQFGIKAFLMKPIVLADLSKTVRNVLDENKS